MALTDEQIRNILGEILSPPLALFSFRIRRLSTSVILEVVLDHLENRYGSASIEDCERVSRKLKSWLDSQFPELDYQLRVQSAGAERSLQLPRDLHRFQGLMMNLEFEDERGGFVKGVFRLLKIQDGLATLEPGHRKKKKSLKLEIIEVETERIKKGNLVLQF